MISIDAVAMYKILSGEIQIMYIIYIKKLENFNWKYHQNP